MKTEQKQHLRSRWLFLTGVILMAPAYFMDSIVLALFNIVGSILVLVAIVNGIINFVKSRARANKR